MAQLAETVFRDFAVDGVPSSGVHEPIKRDIRELLTNLELGVLGGAAGAVVFDTKANLDTALNYVAHVMAWVIGDPTVGNNGIYQKIGVSGSGSWERRGDLPYSFIKAADAGLGTANAIVATTSVTPLPAADGAALIALNIFETNTGPTTVSFNGGAALTIKTNNGNDVQAGYLISGMVVAGYITAGTYRLISEVGTSADKAAAEAAAAAAAQSAIDAVNAASVNFSTRTAAMASSLNTAPDYIRTSGYTAAGIGGALYKNAGAVEPVHTGKFSITLDDAVTVVWYELAEDQPSVLMFGTFSATDNSAMFQSAIDYCEALGKALFVPGGLTYAFTAGIVIRASFFRLFSDSGLAILRWNNTTQFMITVSKVDPVTEGAVIAPCFENMRLQQGTAFVPTAGGFFDLVRVAQPLFHNVRTDNAFRHYSTRGMTRATFSACLAYGSTLFPSGAVVAGSSMLRVFEYDLGGGTFTIPANIKVCNGTEFSSNDATRKNMDHIVHISSCDGFFTDSSSYFGLSGNAVIFCIPERAASQFTNFQDFAFKDGGQSSATNCVEFTENSPGFMTGACNSIVIGGILSGPSGSGIRQNIAAMTDLRIPATVKVCAAYGINWLAGTGLNIGGISFFSNGLGDINNPTGAEIFGVASAKTNRTRTVASATAMTLPSAHRIFNISGAIAINTINGGWPGREVILRFSGALTVSDGAGNLDLAGDFVTTGTNDTLHLITIDGTTWFEVSRSNN